MEEAKEQSKVAFDKSKGRVLSSAPRKYTDFLKKK
jgi:hypothetical protein